MTVRVVIFLFGIGSSFRTQGQQFTFSMGTRCSLPLNGAPQPSYHLDLGYADSSWAVDWIRIDHASAYLFKTIDVFTVDERTRSVGLACGLYLHRRNRLELRAGVQLRYSRIERYVGLGFANYDDGTYVAHGLGFELPVQVALRLGRSSPFHFFAEAVPGYASVLTQRIYGSPDPSMPVRSTLGLGVILGFRVQLDTR